MVFSREREQHNLCHELMMMFTSSLSAVQPVSVMFVFVPTSMSEFLLDWINFWTYWALLSIMNLRILSSAEILHSELCIEFLNAQTELCSHCYSTVLSDLISTNWTSVEHDQTHNASRGCCPNRYADCVSVSSLYLVNLVNLWVTYHN